MSFVFLAARGDYGGGGGAPEKYNYNLVTRRQIIIIKMAWLDFGKNLKNEKSTKLIICWEIRKNRWHSDHFHKKLYLCIGSNYFSVCFLGFLNKVSILLINLS